jgi:plastocyanin
MVTIRAAAQAFDPMTTTIAAGTTVQWVNGDGVPHTVTSGTGSASADAGKMFDEPLGSGQAFSFVFSTPGTYPYFCRPHEAANMRGTITVTGGGTGGTGGGGTGGTGGGGAY